jgi:hypothetical protein
MPYRGSNLIPFGDDRPAFTHLPLPIWNCDLTDEWFVQYAGFSEDDWKASIAATPSACFPD